MDYLKLFFDSQTLKLNHVDEILKVDFRKEEISSSQWSNIYKNKINSLDNRPAVYTFSINKPENVVYVGMSGKINQGDSDSRWSIRNRLMASRGKDSNGKDVSTKEFIRQICVLKHSNIKRYNHVFIGEIDIFIIQVYYPKENILCGFLEAYLINDYYIKYKSLPQFNLAF
jgi:hypothetical protein